MNKLFKLLTLVLTLSVFSGFSDVFRIYDTNNFQIGTLLLNSYTSTNTVNVYKTNTVIVPVYVTNIVNFTNSAPVGLTNKLPIISISSPTNNQVFSTPSTINITANASDSDGTISKVEFYVNDVLASTDTSSPYSYSSLFGQSGAYSLQTKVYDNSNSFSLSQIVNILVTNIPPPIVITNTPPPNTNPPPVGSIRYIRKGATGGNNGSDWNNAYTSIPVSLTRGYTYYISAGSYSGYNFNTTVSGTSLITIKRATISEHGSDAGWNSSFDNQVIFNNQLLFNSSNWILDGQTGGGPNNWEGVYGFQITENGASSAVISIGTSASSGGVKNITVRHTKLIGMNNGNSNGGSAGNDGIAVYNNGDLTFSYIWIINVGRCPFFFHIGSGNTIVEYANVGKFYANATIHGEIASIYPVYGDVTFRYSLFTDSQSTGGIMWGNEDSPSTHCYVYGNVFYQKAGASWTHANGVVGGWTTSGNSNPTLNNMYVYNNTFINVDYLPLGNFPASFAGCIAKNNIFYNTAAPSYRCFPVHDYNHYVNSGTIQGESNGSTSTGDPFVDFVNLKFNLKANTSSGQNLGSPYNIDGNGKTRTTWTRGAYEF